MTDRRSYKLATQLEVLLPRDITSANGRYRLKAGEIVKVLIDPTASVKVYRRSPTEGVTATFSELSGAEIVRQLA